MHTIFFNFDNLLGNCHISKYGYRYDNCLQCFLHGRFPDSYKLLAELHIIKKLMLFIRLEKEILDRYLDVVLKGNKDGLKVIYMQLYFCALQRYKRINLLYS